MRVTKIPTLIFAVTELWSVADVSSYCLSDETQEPGNVFFMKYLAFGPLLTPSQVEFL